jgi:predicted metal-dependent phosphotriesterase family hydrolase
MATITSVLGPIEGSDLGFTLMHEHVMVCASGLLTSYPDLLGEDTSAPKKTVSIPWWMPPPLTWAETRGF